MKTIAVILLTLTLFPVITLAAEEPGSRIYVVRGPFRDWDMKFIFELVYHDRTVNAWLGEKVPLPPEEIRKMDYVVTWEDAKLVRLRGPGESRYPQ